MSAYFQNLLLENIGQLEDKEEEEESLMSSNLPLTSDNNYLKLTAEDDEADMMEEMDREMGTLDLKDSQRVHFIIRYNYLKYNVLQ